MKKKRHQVKSSYYYLFWGIATASVVAGQVFAGYGYRMAALEIGELNDKVQLILDINTGTLKTDS